MTTQTAATEPRSINRLARTVHELRTPLTSVIATLELLKLESVTRDEAEDLLEGATAAALHLDHLIGDILDEEAIASGRLRLVQGRYRVRDLLDEVARIIGLQAIDRGIHLILDEPDLRLRVLTDERRFVQVALNLIGNALKFAPRGGRIEVRVLPSKSAVRFEVMDNGPGVPPATRDQLFVPFAPIAPHAPVRGTGLGLALTKQLTQLLGGQIGFEPVRPHGSCFWFEVPRAVAPMPGAT